MQSLRKFDEKETVAIIGDGPIALLEAIELAKKGVKSVIIGPRHGRYTRSGDIVPEVFQKITKMVGFNVLPSARGAHIKDIERKLYEEAKKMSNITFINGKFAGFEGERQLVIEHNNESDKKKEHIKAYIAIDCTGTKRAVIQAFNESIKQKPEYKSNPFSITRLCNPKMPHHFIAARTLLTEDELTIYTKPSEISPQSTPPLSYALMIITLKELGWTSLVPPFFYINSPDYENHGFTNMSFTRTFKSNIYSNTFDADEKEITSDENMIKYIQVAFKFFEGLKPDSPLPNLSFHRPSRKYPEKKVIRHFSAASHGIVESGFIGDKNYPTILHSGDATLNLPFYTGKSFLGGVLRIEEKNNNLTIREGEITEINLGELQNAQTKRLSEFKDAFSQQELEKSRKIWDICAPKLFIEAEINCTESKISENDIQKIQKMRDTLVLDVTRSLCLQIRDQLDQSMPENKITIQQKLELIDKYKDVLSKDQKNELNIFLKNILKTYQNAKTIKTVKPLIESIIKSKNIYYPKARKIDDNQPPFLKYYISYTPRPVPELKNSTKPSCGDIRLFTPRARISQESTTSNYSFMQLLSLSFRKLLPSTNMTSESKKEMSIVYLKK